MTYRTGLEIKLLILHQLADRPYVLNELERRVETNGAVLRRHLHELSLFGLVRLKQHPYHKRNGQEYTTAEIDPSLPQERFDSIARQKLRPEHQRPRSRPNFADPQEED